MGTSLMTADDAASWGYLSGTDADADAEDALLETMPEIYEE